MVQSNVSSCFLNKASVYLLLWGIYSLQGALYPVGTFFSQFLLLIILVESLYYCFVVNRSNKSLPPYITVVNVLLVFFGFYGAYLIIDGGTFDYIKQILLSFLPLYPFYFFSKEGCINERYFFIWFVFFFFLAVMNYYENYQRQLLLAMLNHSKADEFTNGIGYEFLAIIPICVFFKNTTIQYFMIFSCSVFILMGMKRGSIIILFVCLIWFIWYSLNKSEKKKKIVVVFLSLFLCGLFYQFIQIQMVESAYFQKRLEDSFEGNSSGRDKIYSAMLSFFWNETTPLQFLFGSGANATLRVARVYAHNDWLEIAVNQGLLGLMIYMIYFLIFFKTVLSKRNNSSAKLALQLVFIICFMKTLFSMSYNDMNIGTTFVLGYCLAQEKI